MFRGRPVHPPKTALSAAMRKRRGDVSGDDVAAEIGVTRDTFYRIERGSHIPSIPTAEKLASWLGWSIGQVIDAAMRPPGP